jgi:hypothetical protein
MVIGFPFEVALAVLNPNSKFAVDANDSQQNADNKSCSLRLLQMVPLLRQMA